MANFWRDTVHGLRLLRKNPGFASVAILALALGIGANTAIFSVVYGAMLSPLPYRDPDKLVVVWSTQEGNHEAVSPADFLDWQRESTVFDGLVALQFSRIALSDSTGAELIGIGYQTPGTDKMFGQPLLLGRGFLPEEGEPGKDRVVDLSYETWRDRFGSDPNILGKTIRLGREPYTVVGVYRPAPTDREVNSRLSAPLAFKPGEITRDDHSLLVEGRLKPGVSLAQANAEMAAIVERIDETYPASSKGWGVSVVPLKNAWLDSDLRSSLLLLMIAVGFVLLIACADVANLLLAQGAARQREIAVRGALGATRGQVIRQFLTESLWLAAVGAALGVALAWVLVKVIVAVVPRYTLPTDRFIGLQYPVLLFALAITVVSSLLFGSAPAWQAARLNLSDALKEGGRSAIGARRHWLRRALVVTEFALALTLLAGGGLAIRSFWKLTHVDLGFRRDHVLTFYLPLRRGQLKTPEQIETYYSQFLDRISALPGVTTASAGTGMPVYGPGFDGVPFSIAGQAAGESESQPVVGFSMVTPAYFDTFGIRIDRGRAFTEEDTAGSARVAIVSEQFVKKYLSGRDPLSEILNAGQPVVGGSQPGPPVAWQIVGVSHDVRNRGVRNKDLPEMYVPFWQSPWPWAVMAVRTASDPASVSRSIAGVVRSIDPDLPMAEVMTMDQIVDESMDSERFEALLFGSFSGVALLLAALGIYGVMAFEVEQRTHEIGLRMALGAGRAQVLALILKDGMIQAVAGLALGFVGAFFVGRAMQSRLYGIGAIDPVALGGVAAVLLAAALLACYVPARRATKVDPMVALREE
jgi:putative ABC transport system permease protein